MPGRVRSIWTQTTDVKAKLTQRKTTQSLKTDPRIKVENSKFSCRIHTCKNCQS